MLFSELYSAYYKTVAKIIELAIDEDMNENDIQKIIKEEAFSESVLTILPSLKSGKWPLLNDDFSSALYHKPTMPLTALEKRWLKAISEDPRVKLFDINFPDLDDVKPLYTKDDYKIYDQYSDGDPFEDENYIRNFRILLCAIRSNHPVRITLINRHGKKVWFRFFPKGFEYSLKDDKIRIVASGCKFKRFNLGRVIKCELYNGNESWQEETQVEHYKDLTLMVIDKRNALERAMLHFAHFEKQVERLDDEKYILHLKYYENDETEVVIRVLSFGPNIKVIEPQSFVDLIQERLILQKSCELT